MSKKFAFRAIRASDIPGACGLIRAVWAETYAHYVSARTLEAVLEWGEVETHVALTFDGIIIAEREKKLVGLVSTNFGWISGLFVANDFRMQGVGTQLLSSAEKQGGRELEVHCFNSHAENFLRKRGWHRSEEYIDDLWGTMLPAIRMAKRRGYFNPSNAPN